MTAVVKQNLAFVFPGQGSQKIGMLAEAADQFAEIKTTFAEASDALGYDMWDLIQNGEQEAINLTEKINDPSLNNTPALFAFSSMLSCIEICLSIRDL